jgi:hypothetical protein
MLSRMETGNHRFVIGRYISERVDSLSRKAMSGCAHQATSHKLERSAKRSIGVGFNEAGWLLRCRISVTESLYRCC